MHARFLVAPVVFLCLVALMPADTPPSRSARQLLYPAKLSDVPKSLRPHVEKLLDPKQGTADAGNVKPGDVFARVVTRKYIADGAKLKPAGKLGGRPFVFATIPETLYGRTLLQVFAAIGYSADDVLTGEVGVEKALVVFRWGDKVPLHKGRDGALPQAWSSTIYPATWDNMFALVERMSEDRNWNYIREKGKPGDFLKLEFRSAKERLFVCGYPDAGKKRLKTASYAALMETGGADWEYRTLLERAMSASEHYTGTGLIKPTIVGKGKPPKGFPEFLGPNCNLKDLPEVAVIGLGKLHVK